MSEGSIDNQRGTVHSVDRAVRLMLLLARYEGSLSASEMARRLDLHKSTVSRLLTTLAHHDLVAYDRAKQRYQLGAAFLRLATAATPESRFLPLLRPSLESLAKRTQESVNICVLRGTQVYHLDQIASSRFVGLIDWVGRLCPAYASSAGRAMIAYAPEAVIDHILTSARHEITPHTKVEPADLYEAFAAIRAQGYEVAVNELEVGMTAISAPVGLGPEGAWGAVSVAGPTHRLSGQLLDELIEAVLTSASEMSLALGGADPDSTQSAPMKDGGHG